MIERIWKWKDKVIIMTSKPTTDPQMAYDKNHTYWFYMADLSLTKIDSLYSFSTRAGIYTKVTNVDLHKNDLYFTQGDFLGKLNLETNQVDSIYFYNAKRDSQKVKDISSFTFDNNGNIWILGKNYNSGGYYCDFVAKLDDNYNVIKQFDNDFLETRIIIYDKFREKLWTVGKHWVLIDMEEGCKYGLGMDLYDPALHAYIDQMGQGWSGSSTENHRTTIWYGLDTRDSRSISSNIIPYKDIFAFATRPGTKEVWMSSPLCGLQIYIYADYVPVEEKEVPIPTSFQVYPNYPNPFNTETAIRFTIPRIGLVQVVIYNNMGQKIKVLTDKVLPQGNHVVHFINTQNLPSGIYIYQIKTASEVKTGKMMLVK